MELSSPELIAQLLATHSAPEPRRASRPQSPASEKIQAAAKRPVRPGGRCRCGHCRTCSENARWDRIFNEKFADPYYYEPRPVRHASSLDWLR